MLREFEGRLRADDEQYALVVSRYNESVTRKLLDGALETLKHHGVDEDRVTVVWVPGSFEIPLAAHRLAHSGRYAAVCCLGAVIQGETMHHEYINQQVSRAIMQSSLESGTPVIFGVLTCQNLEQALERAGGRAGHKGEEAALAAIEMVNLMKSLTDGPSPNPGT